MRKLRLLLALAAALALPCFAAPAAMPVLAAEAEPADNAAKEGTDGGIKWSFNESDGKLTIAPADTPLGDCKPGEMSDFENSADSPWSSRGECIKEVHVEEGVTRIGACAFNNPKKDDPVYPILERVTGGKELEIIGVAAFGKCPSLSTFEPTGVREIGEVAFSESGLESFASNGKLTTIGPRAFAACERLKSFNGGNALITIGDLAFYGCRELSGTFLIGSDVAMIGDQAFNGTAINKFAVAAGKTTFFCRGMDVSIDGFDYGVILCRNDSGDGTVLLACAGEPTDSNGDPIQFDPKWLKGVSKIGNKAFYGVSFPYHTGLEIPYGVKVIGESAFAGCEWLKGSLTIPNSVEEVGNAAFAGCSGLSGTLTLGSRLQSVEEHAFNGALLGGANYDGPKFEELVWARLDGDCKATIGNNAFYTCQFTSLVLPEGVAKVGNSAFNWDESLIVLPSSLKYLERESFYVSERTVLYVSNDEQVSIYSDSARVHLNGGTIDPTDENRALLKDGMLPKPTRAGYAFECWFTNKGFTGKRVEAYTQLVDGETYYAKWAPDPPAPTPTPTPVPVPPPATETTVTKNPDGSTTTTVRDRETGKETVTREYKEGVVVVTAREPGAEPRATVTLPAGVSPFLVTLPVDATEATVAAHAGTREVINRCVPTDDGLAVLVTRSCELVAFDNAKPFSDMAGHWAQGAVDFASARGLMNGIGGTGTFEPETHTSRSMVCAVLSNLEYGPEATKGLTFADTASDGWYAEAVAWAFEAGIVHGYGDGSTFGPSDDVTREQMACMIYNYARAMGMDTSKRADLSAFGDASDLTFGREAMEWCVASGVFHGYEGKPELGATDGLTRAQCAAVLMNLVTLIVLG